MTGYGMAEGILFGNSVRAEIRSLNSRYFDFSSRAPALLAPFESDFKKLVQTKIKRGKISLSISLNNNSNLSSAIHLDEKKIAFYIQSLKRVGKKFGIKGHLQLNDLLSFPDIFVPEQKKYSKGVLKQRVISIVRGAVHNLITMKMKEGSNIEKDLCGRIKKIEKAVLIVERSVLTASSNLNKKLKQRIKALDSEIKVSPERLEAEIAFQADKCDVTEEIVRLKSHVNIFCSVLDLRGEAGKRLEFIAQEINREANTIASKSQNASISQHVIGIKLEVEKIREQVQNIE